MSVISSTKCVVLLAEGLHREGDGERRKVTEKKRSRKRGAFQDSKPVPLEGGQRVLGNVRGGGTEVSPFDTPGISR
jgi:hypothetical protein